MIRRLLARTLAAVALAVAALPSSAVDSIHLGVASCADSNCHGAKAPLPGSVVEQNEFLIWSQYDKHAKTYAALTGEHGKRIAANLGLASAEQAGECLACHADNAPASLRGKGFRIEDGVGCEACHGGASNWLGVHMAGYTAHGDSLAAGLYPTEDPTARAKLCLGCHQFKGGESSQHRYYAAGHPRLRFELDTYTEERPGHHKIDGDYRRRKPGSYGARAWTLGQVAMSRKIVGRLLETREGALWPDYAVFACFGCHRKFDQGQPGASGMPPLQDAPIEMTALALSTLGSASGAALSDSLAQLNRALAAPGPKGWRPAADKLAKQLEAAEKELRVRKEGEADAGLLYAALLARASAAGPIRHHLAEQATYALATLRLADLQLAGRNADAAEQALDKLFEAAGITAGFDSLRWREAAQDLAAALPAEGGAPAAP